MQTNNTRTTRSNLRSNSRRRCLGAAATVLVVTGSTARAQPVITVMQESAPGVGDFSTHVVGTIRAWRTDLNASAFFNYANCRYQGTTIVPVDGRVHTFFADTANGLALMQVHDAPGGGGARCEVRVEVTPRITGETWITGSPSWHHWWCQNSGWRRDDWDIGASGGCNTGVVRMPLVGGWAISTQFTQNISGCSGVATPDTPPIQGLFDWTVHSAGGDVLPLVLNENRRVRFVPCNTPSISAPIAACVGDAKEIVITPGGVSPFTYQWRKNGVELPGKTARTLLIPAVADSDAGRYDCIVTNTACGAVTTRVTTLTIRHGDFNGIGGVSIQDVFDFLVAYFAGDLRADMNLDGSLGAQDIFDYLAAYFSGCA